MMRATVIAVAVLAFGCAAREHKPTRPLPRPTIDDFRANIRYPYHTPVARQQQMQSAIHILHQGMTETEVLQAMGPPDYKAPWYFPPDTRRGEIWHYVHTWERPIMPDYHGKMVTITLDERVRPRTLLDFDASDFGVRRHQ